MTDIGKGNISKENFPYFRRLITKSKPFLIHQPTAINQKSVMMSLQLFNFFKMCSETVKNS